MRQLLKLLLLLAGLTARAQDVPVAPAPTAATDTVAAIHRLFAYKRHQRTGLLVMTLGTGGLLFYGGTQASSFDTGVALGGAGVLAIPASLAEAVLYHRYGPRHEERAIAAFQAHRPPRWLRRKLKDYYFTSLASRH